MITNTFLGFLNHGNVTYNMPPEMLFKLSRAAILEHVASTAHGALNVRKH